MGWALTKHARANQSSFIGIALHSHASVCPVLLAWGWKDWASQLDTWAGKKLWHELLVAIILTIFVATPQILPCFQKFKAAVAGGGPSDTLLARYMILPASFLLTLGYTWNVVATWVVGKIQNTQSAPTFHFIFTVQFVYSVIVGVAITVVSVKIVGFAAKRKAADAEKGEGETQAMHNARDWVGLEQQNCLQLVPGILAFVYGWALLDAMDDLAFGIMFHCSSYSTCSYQSNFVYAMSVMVAFAGFTFLLDRFREFSQDSPMLCKAVDLQINAMVLTVGWAWINFYTQYMSGASKGSPFDTAEHSVVLYVASDVVILVLHSTAQFILTRTHQGLTLRLQRTQKSLELPIDKKALPTE